MNITNTYSKTVSLTLSKEVQGRSFEKLLSAAASKTNAFSFTIYLKDAADQPITGKQYVTTRVASDASAINSGINNIQTESGKYYVTFDTEGKASIKLRHGQAITFSDLPAGYSYEIRETKDRYYTTDIYVNGTNLNAEPTAIEEGSSVTYLIASGDSVKSDTNVAYINKVNSLTISKTVSGEGADTNETFSFTITLKDKNGDPIYDSFAYYDTRTGKNATISFNTSGQAGLTLRDQEAITIFGLPNGYQYEIQEAEVTESAYYDDATFYQASYQTWKSGVAVETAPVTGRLASGNGDNVDIEVKYDNERLPQTFYLTLQKTVTGDFGEVDKAFQFDITLKKADGTAVSSSFAAEISDGVDVSDASSVKSGTDGATITFADGHATVFLKHGQSIKIKDIPEDYTYQISEESAQHYTTTISVKYEKNVQSQTSSKARVAALHPTGTSIDGTDTGERTVDKNETVTYINARMDIVPTGFHTNFAPLAIFGMLTALLAGIAVIIRVMCRKYRKLH
jgi:hypothetical protein